MGISRRKFIASTALTIAGTHLIPRFLGGNLHMSDRRLIVIQLSGGNDGLNTIVPYRNDIYFQNRPEIAVNSADVIPVGADLGFNPSLAALESEFKEGRMTVINGVGYPNPNRSHFRSMDIWHTAEPEREIQTGWLGRYLDNECSGAPLHHAIEVNDSLSLAMKGSEQFGLATRNLKRLERTARHTLNGISGKPAEKNNASLNYLYKTANETRSSISYLHKLGDLKQNRSSYPQNGFGNNLQMISNLIAAGSQTQIYYTSLDGFDTHAQQRVKQDRILQIYARGMKALIEDLRACGEFDNTLILTFSEFGRRIKENASKGTDHGTANNVFVMGGTSKGGFYNEPSDLEKELNNDLVHSVDFRQVYATVLDKWFNVSHQEILGAKYDPLSFIS